MRTEQKASMICKKIQHRNPSTYKLSCKWFICNILIEICRIFIRMCSVQKWSYCQYFGQVEIDKHTNCQPIISTCLYWRYTLYNFTSFPDQNQMYMILSFTYKIHETSNLQMVLYYYDLLQKEKSNSKK